MKRYIRYYLIFVISCIMLLPTQVKASENDVFLYSDDTIDNYQGQSTICITKDATFKNISLNSKFDQVKKITFTDDVESLPSKVFFQFPNVEVLELPDNLESLGNAFYPMYLDYNYDHPIYSLTKLKSIVIDSSNPYFAVEDNVLYSKDMTELLYYPAGKEDKVYVMPEFVDDFSGCAFKNNRYLEEIKIGARFSGGSYCSLANDVELPNLKRYSVAKDNCFFSEIDGVLFNYDQTELIAYPIGEKVDIYMVPCTVTKLYEYSMRGATIEKLILPSEMGEISIQFSPFENSHIAAVEITDNDLYTTLDGVLYTKNLDSLVYWPSDKKVTELTFPSTLKRLSLDENTIPCISEVTQLTIPRDLSEINSIRDIDSLSTIEVEKGNESFALYSDCLYTSGYSRLLIIPPSTKQTTITIPSEFRFYYTDINGAPSVNTVVIEGTGEDFPYELFPNLTQIKLGKNNKSAKVVKNVLYSASMKKLICYPQNKKDGNFIIPSSVTTLCSNAFLGQNYLQSITLSKNLKYQDYYRWFEGCKKLKEIKVATGNKYLTAVNGVLFTKDMKTLIYYPVGKTTKSYIIPDKTEVFTVMTGNQYLTNLKLSKNLSRISWINHSYLFKNLKSITVPASNKEFACIDSVLYSIGYGNSCSLEIYPMGKKSQSFTIPKDVTYIVNEKIFESHPYLKNLTSQSPWYDVYGKIITSSYEY